MCSQLMGRVGREGWREARDDGRDGQCKSGISFFSMPCFHRLIVLMVTKGLPLPT